MTKIDDEMVRRFERAALVMDCTGAWVCKDTRAGLEAALSPKPEPEIEVSEGMKQAAWEYTRLHNIHTDKIGKGYAIDMACEIYRAMESTRLKEAAQAPTPKRRMLQDRRQGPRREDEAQEGAAYAAKSAPQGVNAAAPVKETGGGVVLVATSDLYGQKVKIGDTVYIGPFGGRKALVVGIQVVAEDRRKTKRFP